MRWTLCFRSDVWLIALWCPLLTDRCAPGFAGPLPVFCCAVGQNVFAGSPCIYHSGCPNFYCPGLNYCPHQWSSCCHTQHHQVMCLTFLNYAAWADVGDCTLQGNDVMLFDTADTMFWRTPVGYRDYVEYRLVNYVKFEISFASNAFFSAAD